MEQVRHGETAPNWLGATQLEAGGSWLVRCDDLSHCQEWSVELCPLPIPSALSFVLCQSEGWELESTKICSKHRQNDPLRSVEKQSKCHASKGEVPSPCDHPASCHLHFGGNPLTPKKHKPTTGIASILTLPKLHLATFIIIMGDS